MIVYADVAVRPQDDGQASSSGQTPLMPPACVHYESVDFKAIVKDNDNGEDESDNTDESI